MAARSVRARVMAQAATGPRQTVGGAGVTPEVGTTEHALFMLVLLELGALVLLRKYFKSAHGG